MNAKRVDIGEEAALVRKARWGNRAAFETLYRRHAGAVHALSLRLTGNAASAEDLTQDTFMRMLQFLGGLRSDRPLRPWLKRVAANAAIDRLRHEQRYRPLDEGEGWQPTAADPMPQDDGESLLRRLPPLVRTVVWLHEIEGWSHLELADRFGRSESWSKSLVSRAKLSLRNLLKEEYANDLT